MVEIGVDGSIVVLRPVVDVSLVVDRLIVVLILKYILCILHIRRYERN